MLAALGAALFAGALYDQAADKPLPGFRFEPARYRALHLHGQGGDGRAQAFGHASNPGWPDLFSRNPGNSLANYFYAMAIWKQQQPPLNQRAAQQVETLLSKAAAIDPKCGDAYLQLGILASSQHDLEKAIGYYTKAIEADPHLGEAHYRLGVAYDRIDGRIKPSRNFSCMTRSKSSRAAVVERQRREVKQFLVVLQGQPAAPSAH